MIGLEIDADHGTKFQIDKQQKNIVNGGKLFDGQDVKYGMTCGPDHHTANNKQRKIMETFNGKVAKTVEESFYSFTLDSDLLMFSSRFFMWNNIWTGKN